MKIQNAFFMYLVRWKCVKGLNVLHRVLRAKKSSVLLSFNDTSVSDVTLVGCMSKELWIVCSAVQWGRAQWFDWPWTRSPPNIMVWQIHRPTYHLLFMHAWNTKLPSNSERKIHMQYICSSIPHESWSCFRTL